MINIGDVWVLSDGSRFVVQGFEDSGDVVIGVMFSNLGITLRAEKILAIELKDPALLLIRGGCPKPMKAIISA